MIPECHNILIDPQERNLDLNKILAHVKNYKSFGPWVGGVCHAGWNVLNHNKILYTLAVYDLYIKPDHSGNENVEFKKIVWNGSRPDSNDQCCII